MDSLFRKSLKRYEFIGQPRFLTFSCYRRLPLLSNARIKAQFAEALERTHKQHEFRLIAWVIMPEHVHLILTPRAPDSTVAQVLRSLKTSISKRVIARWKRLDAPILDRIVTPKGRHRFWQAGGGYDRNIRDEAELIEKIEYVHANPVRRGLADTTCDWPWSSARWYDGQRDGPVTIDPPW